MTFKGMKTQGVVTISNKKNDQAVIRSLTSPQFSYQGVYYVIGVPLQR